MTRPVLALVGPTAAGKTDIAVSAAERVGAEIVAVDAFTVYRGMDVGTAKPSGDVRARVPHHVVDVLDPVEECTVERFQPLARSAIADVARRGRIPLLVGGSGLYFRAVVDGLAFPPTDAAVRAGLEARYLDRPQAAWAELRERDPEAAARMDPANVRRAVRALEVIQLTGRPFSDWRRAWDHHASVYPGLSVVGLEIERAALAARIEQRVRTMFDAGLVQECRALLAAGPLSATARQAIGYQEAADHLEGRCTLDEAVERTIVRTRRYAARQVRWFRSDPRVRWLPPEQVPDALVEAAAG